ncbi:UNVERIFIED_CONTAM: hypothetical protein N8J90_06375 [Halobacillus marinus]
MNIFESNYWSAYLDFLEDFQSLQYKGYTIAHLCHFRSLIGKNAKVLAALEKATFRRVLRNRVTDSTQVQAVFNHFKASHQVPVNKKPNGKIIFHDVYNLMRIPNETYTKYFQKHRTLIIKEKASKLKEEKLKQKSAMKKGARMKKKAPSKTVKSASPPVQYFDAYQKHPRTSAISQAKLHATKLLKKFPNHPIYQDANFRKVLWIQISKIILRVEEATQLFRSLSVSAIVVPSTHYPESRTFVMVAAKHGVPTICMQHGIVSGEFGYLPKIADVDAVYGRFEVDWYISKGVKPKGVAIIGHPRFDLIHKPAKSSKAKLVRQLGLDPKKKTVLVIVRGGSQVKSWRKFLDRLHGKSKVNIIVKDYPSSKSQRLVKSNPYIFSAQGLQLYDLLHLSDAVVSYSSTVGLEAMLAKKPVFILNEPFPGYSGYYTILGKLVQSNPVRLADLVTSYFHTNDMKVYVRNKEKAFLDRSYNQKHPAGKRLAGLIHHMTN